MSTSSRYLLSWQLQGRNEIVDELSVPVLWSLSIVAVFIVCAGLYAVNFLTCSVKQQCAVIWFAFLFPRKLMLPMKIFSISKPTLLNRCYCRISATKLFILRIAVAAVLLCDFTKEKRNMRDHLTWEKRALLCADAESAFISYARLFR